MDVITDLKLAIALLRDKRILVSSNSKARTLILMRDSKIVVLSENATYTITEEDFVDIFKNDTFVIYTQDTYDALAASEKDIEYYSWRHK